MMDENAAEAYRDSVSNDIHDGKFDEDVVARFDKLIDVDKFVVECQKILLVFGRIANKDFKEIYRRLKN